MAVAKGLSALERRVTALQGEARVMEMASDREVRAVGLDMDGVLFGTRMSSAVSQVGIGTSLKCFFSLFLFGLSASLTGWL